MKKKIAPDDLAFGMTSAKYGAKVELATLCLLIVFDFVVTKFGVVNSAGDATVALLIISAALGHAVLIGAYIAYKRCFHITVTAKTISWKAPFREFSAPLEDVAFLGTTVDSGRSWLKNTVYNRDTIVHLLYGDSHIHFNPECFYTDNTLFERVASYEEQAAWKSTDEVIIAHFEQHCKHPVSEKEKKKILGRYNLWDLWGGILFLLMYCVPLLPVLYFEAQITGK